MAIMGMLLMTAGAVGVAQPARGNDDIRDLPFVLDAVNDALETARTNTRVPWNNPATGNGGVIIVEKAFYPSPEMPCRKYRRTYNQVGKGEMMTRGTGCRVGPARWKIEEETTASQVPKATKSGQSPGPVAGSPATSRSPVGGKATGQPRLPKQATPRKTVKKAVKAPSSPSPAAKAKPKVTPAAPALPEFTMPSKSEI